VFWVENTLDLRAGIDLIVAREEVEAMFAIIGSLGRDLWKGVEEERLIRGSGVSEKGGVYIGIPWNSVIWENDIR
jgi:hypothetical protein